MHFGVFLGHFSPLAPGPHHEGIHWSFYSIWVFAVIHSALVGVVGVVHSHLDVDVVVV